MDTVLLTIGDWTVTYGMAGIAGIGAILLLLVVVTVLLMRGGRKAENAAQTALEGLRTSFVQQIAERDGRIRDLETRVHERTEANAVLQAKAEGLNVRLQEKTQQAEENYQRLLSVRQQMTDEFKLIAADIMKTHGETFTKQNREQVDTLLKPLQDKIGEFHTGLLKDRAAMTEQIRLLHDSNLQITTEAHNLTRALKSNSQAQGAWGEMILSTILERSGLREGEQYITQTSHTLEDGSRVRTDVEVIMPNADRLIVDSKVSLTAFEAFSSTEDDVERAVQLQAHVASMRAHIKTLGAKTYQRHAGSGLDYVMMFVPIEAAFAAALSHDPKIIEFGIEQGVMLTTPTTLMTALRTVRNVWDIEKRHRNAEEIAERAGRLFDKVSGFLGTMDKLGQHMERAQQSFTHARDQLSTGSGNVVRQVEMLRELGAKSSKTLPDGWDGGAESDPAPRLAAKDGDADV